MLLLPPPRPQVRERALRVMSTAYRQVPVAAVERVLHLREGGEAIGARCCWRHRR